MSAKHLSKVGSDLVRRCGTRDPFRIAQELGIEVLFCDDFGPLKGMYRVIKRNRFIFIKINYPCFHFVVSVFQLLNRFAKIFCFYNVVCINTSFCVAFMYIAMQTTFAFQQIF